jgi:hypothetical protein
VYLSNYLLETFAEEGTFCLGKSYVLSFYYIYKSKQEVSQVVSEEDSNHISSKHPQCTSNGKNKHLVVN